MARFFTLFAAALIAAHCSAASTTDERPTVVVGFSAFPPKIYTDEQGQAQGLFANVTRDVLRQAGYQASFRSLPTARLIASLQDGSVDVWLGSAGRPELAAHTLETRHQVTEIELRLYHRNDTPTPNLPDGLAGRGVIIIGGYGYRPKIIQVLEDPHYAIRLHRTGSHLSGLRMLQHRRADFLLGYRTPVEHARQQLGMAPLPSTFIERLPIHFIISRYAPDSEALRDALDLAYEQLLAIPGWPHRSGTEPQPASGH